MANYHKHWYGTLADYTAVATKDSNTLYHCSEGLIYKGSVLLATRRWGDLSGVPSTFAPSAHTHSKSQITDFPTTWAWASLTGVPSTFTPSAHTHTFASLSSKPTTISGYGITNAYTKTEIGNILSGTTVVSGYSKSNWDTAYSHTSLTNNPHGVTKSQVGLGNVLNVASYSKTQSDTNLTSAINAIEIGGRNLLLNSKELEISVQPTHYSHLGYSPAVNLNDLKGKDVTLSFWAKSSDGTQKIYLSLSTGNSSMVFLVPRPSNVLLTTEWAFYSHTTRVASSADLNRVLISAGGQYTGGSTSGTVWLRDFKLEKGNKATDWTPAPEDVQAEIDLKAPLANPIFTGSVTAPKVITGGYNYAAQTAGVGIGADGTYNGVMFYNGTGASGRIYRSGDVLYFNRGGDTSKGFELSASGALIHRNNFTVTGTTSLDSFTATSGSATSLYASSSVRAYGHVTKPVSFGDSTDGILILCPFGMGSANNVAGTIYITRTTGAFMTTRLDFGYSTGLSTPAYNAYLEYIKGSYSPSDAWELVSLTYSGQDWVGLRRTSTNQYFYTSAHFSGENLYDGPNGLTWISASSATGITTLNYSTSRKVLTQAVTMDSSLTVLGSASFQSVSATSFSGPLTGNASSATILATARTINGVSFNGSANITITANTPYTLTRGGYLTGSNFNGSANTTWAVDATSANTASKVVARDSNGDFACRVVTASSGVYSLKVVTGGYNYTTQTHGVGIGTDGSNSGVIFYNGTGATGRIYRESDVMRFIRGGLSYSGFDINADGSVTVQGDMTTRTSLVVGSGNGTYVQIGSARLVYDQTNNAIKVVNADNSSCSLYATGSISAFGIGSSGSSGSGYTRLDDWGDYVDGLTNDYILSAELGHGLYTSVNSLNSFKSGTAWGGSASGYSYLSIDGTIKALSIHGHSHSFASLSSKPTTLSGYGITDAMPLSGGTFLKSTFQILELKRNAAAGASMTFSNTSKVLAKFGFDVAGSLVIGTGTSTDGVPDMFSINGSTKKITGYGDLAVSGSIETGTSDGAYVRIGNSRFLFDSAVSGLHLFSMSGGYGALRAGSVYANNVELTSSRSMKKDIQPFKNGLDLIKSIDVVSYLYKQDADDDDRKIGFIADDTDSWLSGKSKTKYNIGNTVGALIKAVQELEKKNQELEKRLLSTTNNKLRI